MNNSRIKVDNVDSNPRKILTQPISTKAVLGTLKKYEAGYIIGVIAHLYSKTHKMSAMLSSIVGVIVIYIAA